MNLLILSCFVAGIPHRSPDLSLVNLSDEVQLRPDPTNEFDPSAIQVHVGSQFLGFVPREQTEVILSAIRQGFVLNSWVQDKSMTKWKEVLIRAEVILP